MDGGIEEDMKPLIKMREIDKYYKGDGVHDLIPKSVFCATVTAMRRMIPIVEMMSRNYCTQGKICTHCKAKNILEEMEI